LPVAQNIKAPEELRLQLLENLVNHLSDRVQVKIAENANTPIAILVTMNENLRSSS
jgi:hypothetical protein